MVFLGDITLAGVATPAVRVFDDPFGAPDLTVANLEGAIAADSDQHSSGYALYNTAEVLPYLQRMNTQVVSLANNHVGDLPHRILPTIELLRSSGIASCGAGGSLEDAQQPALVVDRGSERVFLAFGWPVIGCRKATNNTPGVNPLETRHLLRSVQAVRAAYPSATLTLLVHWDYELELYPQPMHRELAWRAVDTGADAVVGCHSHCVQGVEFYGKAPIVYGLGNWFLPAGVFFQGMLRFPEFANLQLAFQWFPESDSAVAHLFDYNPTDHSIHHRSSESLASCSTLSERSPFRGMDHEQYRRWFTQHRRKKKLLPVYADPDSHAVNRVKDSWVNIRHQLIRAAVRMRLKGGPQ